MKKLEVGFEPTTLGDPAKDPTFSKSEISKQFDMSSNQEGKSGMKNPGILA